MRIFSYLKAVVIVHGKSEKHICEFIRRNLRLKIRIKSDKNGDKSIQINGLERYLNNDVFKSLKNFKKHFEDLEIDSKTKMIPEYFKIFIIMDTDDCNEDQKRSFINKEMFKQHWAYNYIVPIFNNPDLESVLKKSGINISKNKMKDYIKLFPLYPDYSKSDVIQVEELYQLLCNNSSTNMDDFLKFCLNE